MFAQHNNCGSSPITSIVIAILKGSLNEQDKLLQVEHVFHCLFGHV